MVDDLQQRFDTAEKFRLPCPQLNDRLFPPYEVLASQSSKSSKHTVVYKDSKKETVTLEEHLSIQTALENECECTLKSLKNQEWERGRSFIVSNFERALESWEIVQKVKLNDDSERNSGRLRSSDSIVKLPRSYQMPLVSSFSNKSINIESLPTQIVAQTMELDLAEEGERLPTDLIFDTREYAHPTKLIRAKYSIKLMECATQTNRSFLNTTKNSAASSEVFFLYNDSRINRESLNLTSSTSAFNSVVPYICSIPKSCTWIGVKSNLCAEDETVLRALPYFGDDDQIKLEFFSPFDQQIEQEICTEAEELTLINLIERHRSNKRSRTEVYSALSNILQISRNEILKTQDKLKESSWFRRHIKTNEHIDYRTENIISLHEISNDVRLIPLFGSDEKSYNIDNEDSIACGAGIGLGIVNADRYDRLISNYRVFFCRRCYKMNCQVHSIEHPLPIVRTDPLPPFLCPIPKLSIPTDLIRDHVRVANGAMVIPNSEKIKLSPSLPFHPPILSGGMLVGTDATQQPTAPKRKAIEKCNNIIDLLSADDNHQIFYNPGSLKGSNTKVTAPSLPLASFFTNEMPWLKDVLSSPTTNDSEPSPSTFQMEVKSLVKAASVAIEQSNTVVNSMHTFSSHGNKKRSFHEMQRSNTNSIDGLYRSNLVVNEPSINADAIDHPLIPKPSTPLYFLEQAKEKIVRNFQPFLSDVEIVLIEKLYLMYDVYHPTDPNSSGGSCDSLHSRTDFIFKLLGTRRRDEIDAILAEKQVLFSSNRGDENEELSKGDGSKVINLLEGESDNSERNKIILSESKHLMQSSLISDLENGCTKTTLTYGKKESKALLSINTFQNSYQPCHHEGPCKAKYNCICIANSTFCEKYCACSSKNCERQFRGCTCKRSACRTKACPCFAASRTCDPDLCNICGASVHPLYIPFLQRFQQEQVMLCQPVGTNISAKSVKRGDSSGNANPANVEPFRFCSNVHFKYRKPHSLLIKSSQVHGWGAFAVNDIENNDFIHEYVGEIISQDEADRRGVVYDKLNVSYLFTMNEDEVVDATRKGNFAKFINHDDRTPNCCVKIIQNEGDHKIGIFAKRYIKAGEELTFDYNYKAHNAPAWAGGKGSGRACGKTT